MYGKQSCHTLALKAQYPFPLLARLLNVYY